MSDVMLSVVVVNWNGRPALERGLESLERSLANVAGETELIVIDNGSDDGSADYLRDHHPAARLVANAENVGFSPAANQGVRLSSSRYVALVNNDVVCHEDWLRHLVEALDRDERVGAAAAQLRYLHDPGRINSAGVVVDLLGRARDRHDGLPASAEPEGTVEVFGASGGAVVYRRAMLDEVGLLDEHYFAYLEDVDLAWRAQRLGWRAIYVPASIVLHQFSASSSRVRGFKDFLSARNMVWTIARNASVTQLAIAVPAHLVLAAWTTLLAVARRDLSALRGFAAGLREIRRVLGARSGPYLPLRRFVVPRPLRYRVAARLRRTEARQSVEPEIVRLASSDPSDA